MVGREPHAPAAFTPRGIPCTHLLEAELTPGHMVLSVSTRKIPVTDATVIRSRDLVAQCLNHCATPGPRLIYRFVYYDLSLECPGLRVTKFKRNEHKATCAPVGRRVHTPEHTNIVWTASCNAPLTMRTARRLVQLIAPNTAN